MLVTFDSDARPTLFSLAEMEMELEKVFARRVDLLERRGLEASPNPYFRDPVLSSAEIVYAR